MFAVNAAGDRTPIALILPLGSTTRAMWKSIEALIEPQWAAVCEKKGFITKVSFYDGLKLFVQYVNENVRPHNPKEEHLLILDYTDSHNILLYALPPHTTRNR